MKWIITYGDGTTEEAKGTPKEVMEQGLKTSSTFTVHRDEGELKKAEEEGDEIEGVESPTDQ